MVVATSQRGGGISLFVVDTQKAIWTLQWPCLTMGLFHQRSPHTIELPARGGAAIGNI